VLHCSYDLQQRVLVSRAAKNDNRHRRNTMAKSKGKLPKKITIKIPEGVRKSRMIQSLLSAELDAALIASALMSAAGAAAAVLTRPGPDSEIAPVSGRPQWKGSDMVVRAGSTDSGSGGLGGNSLDETSLIRDDNGGLQTGHGGDSLFRVA
jgi:hypothetical protein